MWCNRRYKEETVTIVLFIHAQSVKCLNNAMLPRQRLCIIWHEAVKAKSWTTTDSEFQTRFLK